MARWGHVWSRKRRTFGIYAARYYSVLRNGRVETVKVRVGSSGRISLDLYNRLQTTRPNAILIYVPPLFPSSSSKPPASLLSLNSTVVTIHSRWSPTHPFPIPLHDTLAAYDWVTQNLLTLPPASTLRSSPAPPTVPILVYGTGLGGSLATSLALTESHAARNPTISALAVRDTIFDWSGIAASAAPSLFPTSILHSLRSHLFAGPAGAFDAFASPILFFRTSGLAVPSSFPVPSDPQSSPATATATTATAATMKDPDSQAGGAHVPRKSYLLFPPAKSGLRIPDTRIAISAPSATTSASATRGKQRKGDEDRDYSKAYYCHDPWAQLERVRQAAEMVKVMRRSVVLEKSKLARKRGLDGRRGSLEDDDGGGGDEEWQAEAEQRVGLVKVGERDGEGHGDGGDGGRVEEGEWVREFFEDIIGRY